MSDTDVTICMDYEIQDLISDAEEDGHEALAEWLVTIEEEIERMEFDVTCAAGDLGSWIVPESLVEAAHGKYLVVCHGCLGVNFSDYPS